MNSLPKTERIYPADKFNERSVGRAGRTQVKIDHFETTENGTLMTDIFDYQSPFGALGKLVDRIVLKRYMTKLLIKRNETVKEFAESDKWKSILLHP